MKIAFVVDGGPELGMGHVVHSLALAEELRGKADISLVTCSNKGIMESWETAGFPCHHAKTNRGRVSRLESIMPQVVIIDKLEVDVEFALWVRNILGAKLAVMNCMSKEAMEVADLVVCGDAFGLSNRRDKHMVYSQAGDYPALWLTGPRYWVLRREFQECLLHHEGTPQNILIRIGGINSGDLVDSIKTEVNLGIAVKVANSMELSAVQMAECMELADLVICSPGLTPFEALLVGTPVIIIPQTDAQRQAYSTLPLLEKEDIGKLLGMIERGEFIRTDDVRAMQIGQGKQEVVAAIEAWL